MRKILATLIVVFSAFNVTAQDFKPTNEDYDISESTVKASVTRTKYYIKDSFFDISINSEEFLKEANRDKPTVIYLHGCNYDYPPYERSLLKFYLGLGFNFAVTDFIKRGDAKPACIAVNGVLVVRTNLRARIPARVLELNAHIDWLKANGFKTIYVVGFSEGGMVIQRMQKVVDAVVIHAMTCIPLAPNAKRPTNENKYLQLISTRDPFLDTQGAIPCEGRPGYETFVSAVGNAPSHDPFSDPSWEGRIKEFLGVKNQ
jgi:hypothetical protein